MSQAAWQSFFTVRRVRQARRAALGGGKVHLHVLEPVGAIRN
jgi:hypothetical protein